MKISAALIVRNEETMLPACLESLKPVVDEIVIVDTGSEDRTLAIARQYTPHVHSLRWQDDFALARNHSLKTASGDYVLVADADHRLVNPAGARRLLDAFARAHAPNTVGTVAILSGVRDGEQTHEEVSVSPKFFRRDRFVFEGAIHEQVVPIEGEALQAPTGLQYYHSGYEDRDSLLARIERNRRILVHELEKQPDDEYYLYQLGKADFCRKDYAEAARAFEQALKNMTFSAASLPTGRNGRKVSEDMLIDLLTCLAYSYANLGRHRDGCDLLEQHRHWGHPATRWADFPHALGYLYLMLGDVARAREAYATALEIGPQRELVRGTGGFSAFYHLGLLAEAGGDVGEALGNYLHSLQLRPDYTATLSRCVDLVTEHKAALPPEIWDIADSEALVNVYVMRLVKHLGAGDTESAQMLLAAANATAPGLLEACKAALKELQAYVNANRK